MKTIQFVIAFLLFFSLASVAQKDIAIGQT
jgi:hypothetical protein